MKKYQETHGADVTWQEIQAAEAELQAAEAELLTAEAEQAWQAALQEDQLLDMTWQEILAGEAKLLAELLTAEEWAVEVAGVILQDAGYQLQ